ncbi:MAG TPA: right-handed parallel beta-helix repeat-containing protein, partial [Anaerolineales bacterium]|nr:right-handed parallel beta-helix repeat-containing protein [Anaerolineales bacterium]
MSFKVWNSKLARIIVILALLSAIVGQWEVQPVYAASLLVTNTNDSGPGSLRQAILSAASGDMITFDAALAGKFIILASQLYIDKNLTIDGSGLNPQLRLSGNFSTRILQVASPAQVSISNLWFQDGTSDNGGAVLNVGTLTIDNSTFYNNYSTGSGGAMSGTNITLTNSTVKNNHADGYGGAIYSGGLTIRNTTITRNQGGVGGALHITGNGTTTIVNSTIYRNYAQLVG